MARILTPGPALAHRKSSVALTTVLWDLLPPVALHSSTCSNKSCLEAVTALQPAWGSRRRRKRLSARGLNAQMTSKKRSGTPGQGTPAAPVLAEDAHGANAAAQVSSAAATEVHAAHAGQPQAAWHVLLWICCMACHHRHPLPQQAVEHMQKPLHDAPIRSSVDLPLPFLHCVHHQTGGKAPGGKGKAAAQVVVTDGTPGAAAAAAPAGAVGGTPEPTGVSPMQVNRPQHALCPRRTTHVLGDNLHVSSGSVQTPLWHPAAPTQSLHHMTTRSSLSWHHVSPPMQFAYGAANVIPLGVWPLTTGVYACRLTAARRAPLPCPASWQQRRCPCP